MTINLISFAPSGDLLLPSKQMMSEAGFQAGISGLAASGKRLFGLSGTDEAAEGDFSGLFARLLMGAKQALSDTDAALPTPLAESDNLLASMLAETGILPEAWQEWQAAAREALHHKKDANTADEMTTETEDDPGMLGALSFAAVMHETLPPEAQRLFSAGEGKGEEKESIAAFAGLRTSEKGVLHPQLDATETAKFAVKPEEAAPQLSKTAMASAVQEALPMHANAPSVAGAGAPETPQPVTDRLNTPLQDPRWAQDFGEKIVWMAKNGEQQARLQLNPAHLGPLQIHLNLDTDKVSATITAVAATPEARQAIEDALPRLKEMLAGAGISLGDTQVGTQSRQESTFASTNHDGALATPSRNGLNGAILGNSTEDIQVSHIRRGDGLVDLFA